MNIAFDHTMIKLGDTKVCLFSIFEWYIISIIQINVRTKAFEVMVEVLLRIGVLAGIEKLFVR